MPQSSALPEVNLGIGELKPYVHSRDPVHDPSLQNRDLLKLGSNENPFGASPRVRDALIEAASSVERYPDGGATALRSELAERYDLPSDYFVLGNGSYEILELAGDVFLSPGRTVAMYAHCFVAYHLISRVHGSNQLVVPLVDWQQTAQAMVDACAGTDPEIVYLASPSNPVGGAMEQAEIETVIRAFPRALVIVDLAYIEYVDPQFQIDIRALVLEHPNLIVTRTFSKVHGLAALRVGYGVMSPEISGLLNRVRQPFNSNHFAQAAALASLTDPAYIDGCIDDCKAMRQRFRSWLEGVGSQVLPLQGNFITFAVGADQTSTNFVSQLEERGVVARDLAPYSMPNHVRLTLPQSADAGRVLAALQEVFQQGARG